MNDPTDTNLVDEMIANFRETHHRFMAEVETKRLERREAMRKAMPLHIRATKTILDWLTPAVLALILSATVATIGFVWVSVWRWVVG